MAGIYSLIPFLPITRLPLLDANTSATTGAEVGVDVGADAEGLRAATLSPPHPGSMARTLKLMRAKALGQLLIPPSPIRY